MKKIKLLPGLGSFIVLFLLNLHAQGENHKLIKKDTIMIKMPDKNVMIMQFKDIKDLTKSQAFNIDSLLKEVEVHLSEKNKTGKKETFVYRTEKVMKVDNNSTVNGKESIGDKRQSVYDTSKVVKKVIIKGEPGSETREERILHLEGKSGEQIKRFEKIEVDTTKGTQKKIVKIEIKTEDESNDEHKHHHRHHKKSPDFEFSLDLGLNSLVNTENVTDPLGNPIELDLKPLGSRFLGLNTLLDFRLAGKKNQLKVRSGLGLGFNKLSFDKNIRITDINDKTFFFRDTTLVLEKSKLNFSTINVPLMLFFEQDKIGSDRGFHVGAGGFAGYRLGTKNKLKYERDGDTIKRKEQGNFNLTDFQYGLNFMIGYDCMTFFVKYHLNDLFKDNRGPKANIINFGITIM